MENDHQLKDIFVRPARQIGIVVLVCVVLFVLLAILSSAKNALLGDRSTDNDQNEQSDEPAEPGFAGQTLTTERFSLKVPFEDGKLNSYQSSLPVDGHDEPYSYYEVASQADPTAKVIAVEHESDKDQRTEIIERGEMLFPSLVQGMPAVTELTINEVKYTKVTYDQCSEVDCIQAMERSYYYMRLYEDTVLYMYLGEYDTEVLSTFQLSN
ncbi:MAG: hypothetical protein QY318_00530 [Candidatus Dojkabacteria bacterium]|nr:MAG: hypothetical protein QY318_00530 [Candidatus Dojkabacteria bacterium]